MKTKVIAFLSVLILLLAGAYFFRKQGVPPAKNPIAAPAGQLAVEAGSGYQDLLPEAPLTIQPEAERVEPWGVILQDKVKMASSPDLLKDARGPAIATLNSGDVVLIDETGVETETAIRIVSSVDASVAGWVLKDKLINLTEAGMSHLTFQQSTAPLADLFYTTSSDTDEYKKKQQILVSEDFIKRALKNPDKNVANWAAKIGN